MLPPEPELFACLDVMKHAILQARVWGRESDVPTEQLADLMHSVHNIPGAILHWDAKQDEDIKRELEGYERKWARLGGPRLRTHYEQLVNPTNPIQGTAK